MDFMRNARFSIQQRDVLGRFLSVWVSAEHMGMVTYISSVLFQTTPIGEVPIDIPAALVIDMGAGQSLMDELWRLGIRPHNGEGSDAQVNALKAHIKDLRDTNVELVKHVTHKEQSHGKEE